MHLARRKEQKPLNVTHITVDDPFGDGVQPTQQEKTKPDINQDLTVRRPVPPEIAQAGNKEQITVARAEYREELEILVENAIEELFRQFIFTELKKAKISYSPQLKAVEALQLVPGADLNQQLVMIDYVISQLYFVTPLPLLKDLIGHPDDILDYKDFAVGLADVLHLSITPFEQKPSNEGWQLLRLVLSRKNIGKLCEDLQKYLTCELYKAHLVKKDRSYSTLSALPFLEIEHSTQLPSLNKITNKTVSVEKQPSAAAALAQGIRSRLNRPVETKVSYEQRQQLIVHDECVDLESVLARWVQQEFVFENLTNAKRFNALCISLYRATMRDLTDSTGKSYRDVIPFRPRSTPRYTQIRATANVARGMSLERANEIYQASLTPKAARELQKTMVDSLYQDLIKESGLSNSESHDPEYDALPLTIESQQIDKDARAWMRKVAEQLFILMGEVRININVAQLRGPFTADHYACIGDPNKPKVLPVVKQDIRPAKPSVRAPEPPQPLHMPEVVKPPQNIVKPVSPAAPPPPDDLPEAPAEKPPTNPITPDADNYAKITKKLNKSSIFGKILVTQTQRIEEALSKDYHGDVIAEKKAYNTLKTDVPAQIYTAILSHGLMAEFNPSPRLTQDEKKAIRSTWTEPDPNNNDCINFNKAWAQLEKQLAALK